MGMLLYYFARLMHLALGKGLALLAVCLILYLLWRSRGPAVAAFALVTFAILIHPSELVTLAVSDLDVRTAVASPNIEFATYHAALVVTVILLPGSLHRRHVCLPLLLAPLALYLIATAQNDLPVHVMSGVLQWAWAALAWTCGSAFAEERERGRLPDKDIAWIVTIAIVANAVVAVLQLAGLWRISAVAVGSDVIERVSGLQDHSGNLGKFLLLFLLLLLPLTRSAAPGVARVAGFSVAVCFVTTGFTYSRTNTAAVVAALGIWYVLRPGGAAIQRFAIPLVLAIAAVPFVSVLLLRNEFDPLGGSRPVLAAAAREQARMTFWQGVGPNDYERTVGQFSPISAALPVHNALMLTLVEAGALVALLVAIPFMRMIIRAFRTRRAEGWAGAQATAMLAVLPGLTAVAVTGFGLSNRQLMLLLFMICAFASTSMAPTSHVGRELRSLAVVGSRNPLPGESKI